MASQVDATFRSLASATRSQPSHCAAGVFHELRHTRDSARSPLQESGARGVRRRSASARWLLAATTIRGSRRERFAHGRSGAAPRSEGAHPPPATRRLAPSGTSSCGLGSNSTRGRRTDRHSQPPAQNRIAQRWLATTRASTPEPGDPRGSDRRTGSSTESSSASDGNLMNRDDICGAARLARAHWPRAGTSNRSSSFPPSSPKKAAGQPLSMTISGG